MLTLNPPLLPIRRDGNSGAEIRRLNAWNVATAHIRIAAPYFFAARDTMLMKSQYCKARAASPLSIARSAAKNFFIGKDPERSTADLFYGD